MCARVVLARHRALVTFVSHGQAPREEARSSAAAGERPPIAASQHVIGAAVRSDAWAATPASSSGASLDAKRQCWRPPASTAERAKRSELAGYLDARRRRDTLEDIAEVAHHLLAGRRRDTGRPDVEAASRLNRSSAASGGVSARPVRPTAARQYGQTHSIAPNRRWPINTLLGNAKRRGLRRHRRRGPDRRRARR